MFRFRNQYLISLIAGLIVIGILLNNIIVKTAQANIKNLFWILMASMLLIVFAIYYKWSKKVSALLTRFRRTRHQLSPHFEFTWSSTAFHPQRTVRNEMNVMIGNDQCSQPYKSSVFAIGQKELFASACINDGNDAAQDSKQADEEDISSLRLMSGDKILQIGPEFLGCCTGNGKFNIEKFKRKATSTDVKMIELTLLPAKHERPGSLMPSMSNAINRNNRIACNWGFNSFYNAEGMILFLGSLRRHSGGKPVGFRIRVPEKKALNEICYAITKMQLIPDFIVVEGTEELADGMYVEGGQNNRKQLYDALQLVSKTLEFYKLDKKVTVIAKGKITSGFDMLKVLALGANLVRSVVPAYSQLNNNSSVAKASSYRLQELSDFHERIMATMANIMKACGFNRISDITLASFFQKLDISYAQSLNEQVSRIANNDAKKLHGADLSKNSHSI